MNNLLLPEWKMDQGELIHRAHPAHPPIEELDGYSLQYRLFLEEAVNHEIARGSSEVEKITWHLKTFYVWHSLVFFEKGNPISEIYKWLYTEIDREIGIDEYFTTSREAPEFWPVWTPGDVGEKLRHILVYYVSGDSEGTYVHVDWSDTSGKLHHIFLLKTFWGIHVAARIVALLSKLLNV